MLELSQSSRKILSKCPVDTGSVEMQSKIILHSSYPRKQKGWSCPWKSKYYKITLSLPTPGNFKAHLKKKVEENFKDCSFSTRSKGSNVLLSCSPGLQFTYPHWRRSEGCSWKTARSPCTQTTHSGPTPLFLSWHTCVKQGTAEQREHLLGTKGDYFLPGKSWVCSENTA